MVKLNWGGKWPNEAACEHGHLCAWIEQLPFDQRFAWVIDTPGYEDPEEIVNLDSGVAADLVAAKRAVAEAMMKLGARPTASWRPRQNTVVVDLFPVCARFDPQDAL